MLKDYYLLKLFLSCNFDFRGVNVLEKPELKKTFDNRRQTQRAKERETEQANKRTSLEMKLEQRANRLKEVRTNINHPDKVAQDKNIAKHMFCNYLSIQHYLRYK